MEHEVEEAESSNSHPKLPNASGHLQNHAGQSRSEVPEKALKSIPKRKLSVFYRSFDVITPANASLHDAKGVAQVKRSSSSPAVGEDDDETPKGNRRFQHSYVRARSHEPTKTSSTSATVEPRNDRDSPPRFSGKKLIKVGETMKFEGYDYQKILSKFTGGNQNNDIRCRAGSQSASDQKEISSLAHRALGSSGVPSFKQDPAEIKDHRRRPEGRRTAPSRFDSGAPRFDSKPLAREMSSRENSSCGTESDDDERSTARRSNRPIHPTPADRKIAAQGKSEKSRKSSADHAHEINRERRHLSETEQAIEKTNYLHQCLISSQNGLHAVHKACRTASSEAEDAGAKLANASHRKGGRAIGRSLSEGDSRCWCKCSCSCKCKGNCKCLAKTPFPQKVEDVVQAFPSLTDKRLRRSGFTNPPEGDDWSLYRENVAEGDFERKYMAFSIGLGTDRITLKRRMTLALRQRDLSERNFNTEIQRMQQDIQDLSTLCTDRDSIEKVERARHRLEMVARCSHRVSCAAETLGAVHQEHRISKAVLTADKYLQLLRARCENLATEVVELKRILVKNNIPIEETSGELGDELPRIRYRSGLPTNNRTMMARRRASIATISRPMINPADPAKDGPRQRNSVSGRVTLRRPSLCFESPKWEVERLHLADSVTTAELRGISEQIESRRASLEEKEIASRADRRASVIAPSSAIDNVLVEALDTDELDHQTVIEKKSHLEVDDAECRIQEEPHSTCDLWLHSDQPLRSTCALEKRRKTSFLCLRASEHCLHLNGKPLEWQSILWSVFVFFLGFYVKHLATGDVESTTLLKR